MAPSEPSAASHGHEVEVSPAPARSQPIGASGERVTRDEAFDLVRRAVSALTSGDTPVRASDVRAKAHELLGRDSESLSEANFSRILRDAHDADVIDLRRRGDDYEVARAVAAAPVAQQLNAAAAARGTTDSSAAPTAPVSPALPRGLGVRSARRGGLGVRAASPPPDLLSVGIVDTAGSPSLTAATPATGAARHASPEAEHPVAQAFEPVPSPAVRAPSAAGAPSDKAAAAGEGAPAHATGQAAPRAAAAKKRGRAPRAKRGAPAASGASPAKAKRPRTRTTAKTDV
jgi:hypothetical protein